MGAAFCCECRWTKDVSYGGDIHVTVRNVPSFRTASDFRAALASHVRAVRNVSQRSFAGGTQELDVTLQGSAEEFAQEVEAKKLGKFSVRVLGLTANTVDLDDRDRADQSTVTRISSRCPPGRDVLLYRINDGGHRMPGAFPDARFPRLVNAFLGPQNRDIDGAAIIWEFFRKFP